MNEWKRGVAHVVQAPVRISVRDDLNSGIVAVFDTQIRGHNLSPHDALAIPKAPIPDLLFNSQQDGNYLPRDDSPHPPYKNRQILPPQTSASARCYS